ncbi:MAG: serine/threonine-protein kinase PknK, partial [bacterium]|nr:serine/threonine-protein kinase PknK [bacterium]
MKKILDYEIIEHIDETVNSIVYRGRKGREKGTVIIKVHNLENSSLSKIARFKQEYEIIKNLNFEGILKTYDIIETGNRIALVLEDFEGSSLKTVMRERDRQTGGGETRFFLETAISISDIVGTLHKNNVIHKDIKPHNILINPGTGMLKLIDFGISSELSHENEEIYNRNTIEGTLVYMSPEQTGRLSRGVDYRTDIYSMGITFYEMLTGTVPFCSKDPLEIIHAHIAKKPTPPVEINSSIPPVVSDIVMKLLAKSVEDRYQNSFGVMADLAECLGQFKRTKGINYFETGEKDISLKFNIPRGLFGRDKELGVLLSAFERVGGGAREMMLVAGAPGIGKSVLINEVRKPIVEKRGYFITGKYEQFAPGIPYSSIIAAFRELVRQLLLESSERITRWKEKLNSVLGTYGNVITDVIPDVELIIGEQQDVPLLGPEETLNRFNIVFKKFMRVFAQKEHPLVLFLDDLQWADMASFSLVENIITDSGIESFLLIGAYRDNEINGSHPLMGLVENIKKTEVTLKSITLSTLTVEAMNRYMGGFLRRETDDLFSLAEVVHKKTNGNPFFINQFMQMLYDAKLFFVDSATGWQWDLEKINRVQVTDNVVELMANKISKLKEHTREILKTCACVGNRFNPEIVSLLTEQPLPGILDSLMEAVEEGLLVLRGDVYEFQHDRIQEGAYSLIPGDERAALHYKIGRILLDKLSPEELQDDIFSVVNQLNYGVDLARDLEERHELAGLNLLAGRKAKKTSAYNGAYRYYQYGIEYLSSKAWEREYELALALYSECGEAAFLSGDPDEAQKFLDQVLEKAKTPLDTVKVCEVKITLNAGMNKMAEALAWAIKALTGLGVHIPKKITRMDVLKEQLIVKIKLGNRSIEGLFDSTQQVTDPHKLAIARLLMIASAPAYVLAADSFPYIILKQVNLALEHGNSINSIYAYALYGVLLCGESIDFDRGFRFAQLALTALDRFNAEEFRPKLCHLLGSFISHWKRPLKEDFDYLQEGYRSGAESGDFAYASYCVAHYCINSFYAAEPLDTLKEKYIAHYEIVKSFKQVSTLQYYELRYQFVLNLRGESENSMLIKGDIFDEEQMVEHWFGENRLNSFGHYIECKLCLYYLHGFYKEAVHIAEEGKKYIKGLFAMVSRVQYYLYYSLSLLARYPLQSSRLQKKYLKLVFENQEMMKKWAGTCPENFLHKYLLVQAVLAGVTGKNQRDEQGVYTKGGSLFNRAIASAQENGFTQDEAAANEAAARFYREKNFEDIANLYMASAYACYSRWGAVSKVTQIEKEFPALKPARSRAGSVRSADRLESFSTTGSISESLDLSTVVKASQAISGEIVLSRLLSRLMQLTLENAGAEKGCLLLEKEGKIFVEAEGEVGNSGVRVLES